MDGAKRSKYHTYVVCGVLLILLGARMTDYQFPFSLPGGFGGHPNKCEICGKGATTTLKIADREYAVCEDHAKIEGLESITNPASDLALPVHSAFEPSDDGMRTLDGIFIFAINLTDLDVEMIRKVIAEFPYLPPQVPTENFPDNDHTEAKIDPSDKQVLSIRQQDEGEVHVYTGELNGPEDGKGYLFRMRKEHDHWVVLRISKWLRRASDLPEQ